MKEEDKKEQEEIRKQLIEEIEIKRKKEEEEKERQALIEEKLKPEKEKVKEFAQKMIEIIKQQPIVTNEELRNALNEVVRGMDFSSKALIVLAEEVN